MITVNNLAFNYNTRQIFDGVNFSINDGAKVALVGPNGAGKSTLLEILGGQQDYDAGRIEIIGSIGTVPQEVSFDEELEAAASAQAYVDPDGQKRDDELLELFIGMELDNISLEQKPSSMSGGQKTKLALIRNIIAQPDILILDEPTNFLDVGGKRWVMQFLSKYPKTLVVVSHDIALLDQSITKVLAIDINTKKIDEYTGNYSQHLKLKKQRDELASRQRRIQEQKIKHMTASLSKLKRQKSESGVRRRVQMRRRIEQAKQSLPNLPPQLRAMSFTLPEPKRVGRIALQVRNLQKSFGDTPVLRNVSFIIERGQKVALIGQNGAGKSTLIKTLVGQLEPDAGEVVKHEWLDIGYYAQEHEVFDLEATLVDTVVRQVPEYSDGQARALLGRFMFSGDRAYQSVGSLSGGEKTRLAIALLTVKGHNLLILDEPTTYLDVMSQRVILEVLKEFKGAMLVVSHTEDFIRELEPDRGLILPDTTFDFWRPEMLERIGME